MPKAIRRIQPTRQTLSIEDRRRWSILYLLQHDYVFQRMRLFMMMIASKRSCEAAFHNGDVVYVHRHTMNFISRIKIFEL